MASTTAQTIITGALQILGVAAAGETPAAALMSDGLRRLNLMIGQWSIQPLTVPFQAREVFNLVANQQTYTMGPGGDFDTARPATLLGAGLLMGGTTPPVEIPRALLTDDAYEAIQLKTLTNPLFTDVYFNPTYAEGFASVTLWPIPDNADNQIVLYRLQQFALFTSLTASYDIEEGADEAMEYQLALRLAAPNGVAITPDVRQQAAASFSAFKRNHVRLTDLAVDPAFTHDARYAYNIYTGTGS